uniref:Lipoprotein n=1 Tax=Solibacter usitatus (strain Ellin6076) TaxID=234267 RepID=Q01VX2_SOLUE
MKLISCSFAALTVLLVGCGKEERTEASQFSKTLTAKQANFASANTLEKSFIASARDWCGGITANGAGKGQALDQNAAVAAELAKNAVAIGAELSQVRQAVDDLALKSEFPQGVRATLATQLTKRQRYLQEMRALLEQAGPEFLTYKANKSYAGDLFPGSLNKLEAMLERYAIPNDDVGNALTALKAKYELKTGEL